MAADEQYERKIREDYASHADLLNLWAGIKTDSTPGWQTGKAIE